MKIGPLTLWKRMHANGTPSKSILLASWHWDWSLTWRWHLSWLPGVAGSTGLYFHRLYSSRPGINFQCGANLPLLGSFSLQTQPNMDKRKAAHGTATAPEKGGAA